MTPFVVSTFTLTHTGGGSATVAVNATTTTKFLAQNLGTSSVTATFVVTACSGALQPNSCTVSPGSMTLAPNQSDTVRATFTGGIAAGSGTLTVAAKQGSTTLATSSVAVTVTPSGAHAPTVSQANHVGTRLDVGLCVADCFENTFAYATPAYVSRDVPRSVGLLYRSGRARPHGRLTLEVTDNLAGASPSFRLQLADENGANMTFTNGQISLFFVRASSGATHLVAEFDASTIATSAKLYTAYVTSYDSTTMQGTTPVPIRIIVVNEQGSVYGAGVDLPGVERLVVQSDGVLVTDGSGSASFFGGSCTSVPCSYGSPAGDFSVLAKTATGYSRTYTDGTVVAFNSVGLQTSVADRFGTATTYAWVFNTDAGRNVLSSITDPANKTTTFTYRTAGGANGWKVGSLGAITTPGSRSSNFGVNASTGNLQQINDPDGIPFAILGYDTQHRLTSYTDKKNGAWTYVYAYGKTLKYVDAPTVKVDGGSMVHPRTQVREAYAGLYIAADVDSGTSTTEAIKVPTVDVRAAVTDPIGRSVFYALNRFGSPRKTWAPLLPADSVEYIDSTGQVTRTISPTGHDVRYTWSGSQLKVVNDVTLGKIDSLWYWSKFNLLEGVRGANGQQWLWYDSSKTTWPLSATRQGPSVGDPAVTHYPDQYGRDTMVADPLGHSTKVVFSPSGYQNRTSVRAPNLQVTTFAYDGYGRLASSTDPYGVTSAQSIDSLNRTRWSTATSANDTTRVYYDRLDADSVVKDANGKTYTVYRNALGWPVAQIDPAGHIDSTFYDSAGQVTRTKSRAGRVVTFQYDAAGRVTQQRSAARQDEIDYTYDPLGKWVKARSIVNGVEVSADSTVMDAAAHRDSTVTRRGTNVWRIVHTFNSGDPGLSNVKVYTPASPSTPATYTSYSYDAMKRLTTIRTPLDTTTFAYNTDNLIAADTLRPGLVEAWTYTSSHQLADRSYVGSIVVDSVLGRWYRSDSLARLVARGDTTRLFQAFGYDSTGRLKRWAKMQKGVGQTCVNADNDFGYSCTGAPDITLQQTLPAYDPVGNPADAGTVVAAGNRLTTFDSVTMTYDADGFMLTRQVGSASTDSFVWDDFGRLVSVTRTVPSGSTTTYTYDGFGRRIRKVTGSGADTVQYLWDGSQIALEVSGTGATTQTYAYYPGIDQPRSVAVAGQTYFMSTEPDGTINGLIKKADKSIVAQYAYTPWGELEQDANFVVGGVKVNGLRWKGLPYDQETGLYYVRARYYDPKTRRFISEDPIGLEGGINEYAFAGGDPVNGSDPSGLDGTNNGFTDCYHWENVMWGSVGPFWQLVKTMCPSEPVGPGTGGDTPPSPPGQSEPPHPGGPAGLPEDPGEKAVRECRATILATTGTAVLELSGARSVVKGARGNTVQLEDLRLQ